MLNKILVFGGLALGAILVIENIVGGGYAYIFIDDSGSAYMLSFISIIIGILMGYGLRGMFESNNGDSDNYDF